jgi:DNA-binding MarR family transcriptional regulator
MLADSQKTYDLINEIFLILDDGDRRLFDQFALTTPRFYALMHLGAQPGMSLSELSKLMLCDKSNATRIIKSMEADGLVLRQPHETDGRTLRLYLTPEGFERLEHAMAAHRRFNQMRLEVLDDVEQDNLLACLLHLKSGLQKQLNGQ